jgi:hypothetical protein
MYAYPTDAEWTQSRVGSLPPRFAAYLQREWNDTEHSDYRRANVTLREKTDSLVALRIPLDASDAHICDAARTLADRCSSRAELYHTVDTLRAAMARICQGQGIEPPSTKFRDRPAVARMSCHLWWRRKLRRHHCQALEAAAISLGVVHRASDIYCSNETLKRRIQQNARNADSLERTLATNELGDEFTLAELASKGVGNKANRRSELMTRIAGFERIAREFGHAGVFLTITCPSRFHKWRIVGGWKVIENPNFDPTTDPRIAQQYLAKVWSRIRAKLKRDGIGAYGFRIAEPQHDGTPHWHFLLFYEAPHENGLRSIATHYAMQDSPDERGAQEHRIDFKPIDWEKGSAAGYIAKYVSKNIDGYQVDKDLYGNDAIQSAARVEAWASTWGIHQFQQIGGPPVGVWRELRRVPAIPIGAPEWLVSAHRACNKMAEGHDGGAAARSASWERYCKAQGGVFCGRGARIKLMKAEAENLGRYGDDPALQPVGVETLQHTMRRDSGNRLVECVIVWAVESVRHVWKIARRAAASAPRFTITGEMQTNKGQPGDPELVAREVARAEADEARMTRASLAERAKRAQPWTRVNNCTRAQSFDDVKSNSILTRDISDGLRANLSKPAAAICASHALKAFSSNSSG